MANSNLLKEAILKIKENDTENKKYVSRALELANERSSKIWSIKLEEILEDAKTYNIN